MSTPPNNSDGAQFIKVLLSIVTMVIVAPVVAVITLVCWNPERWGGSLNPLAILTMAFMGVFSAPLWPTYIPAVVVIPFIMRRVARAERFRNRSLVILLGVFFVIGAIAGFGVISIIVPWNESADLTFNWIVAGAISGGFSLALIALIFRWKSEPAE